MLDSLRNYARQTSWPIVAAMIALMVVGVVAIGVSERADSTMKGFSSKQLQFALVGMAVFFAMTLLPYNRLGERAYLLFGLTVLMLMVIFLTPSVRGSHRWFDLKVIKVQPSEIAKFAYILMLAWYLRNTSSFRTLRGLILPFVLTLVPMGLILVEPDLGTAMLFPPTLYMMLFVAGARLRHLGVILALGVLVVLVPVARPVDMQRFAHEQSRYTSSSLWKFKFYHVDESLEWSKRPDPAIAYCRVQVGEGKIYDLQPLSLLVMMGSDQTAERAMRVKAWLQPNDPRLAKGKGYQSEKARIILGSGKWSGRGDWNDMEAFFRILPDDHTDFIFCVVGGQWGFAGCLFVLMLYLLIFAFGLRIAVSTYDPFGRLLVVGVLALLFSQVIINVGMTMGLTPVTGMTLPWVSYGGSSLLVNCAAMGLLINVGQHRTTILLGKKPFEFGQKREKLPPVEVADQTAAPNSTRAKARLNFPGPSRRDN